MKHAFNIAACTFGGIVLWSGISYVAQMQEAAQANPALLPKAFIVGALGCFIGVPSVMAGFWRSLTGEVPLATSNKDILDLNLCLFGSMGIGKAFTDAAMTSYDLKTAGVLLVGSALVGLGYKRVFSGGVPKV